MSTRASLRAAVISFVAPLALLSVAAGPLLAQTESRTFNATADAFNYDKISGGGVTVNNGGNTTLELGGRNGDRNSRFLIRFDPSSVLPSNATILSATLRMTALSANNFTGLGVQDLPNKVFTLSAYRMLATNWVEGTGIFAVQSGAVTWNSARHGVELWDIAGPGPASTAIADTATAAFVYTNTAWSTTALNSNFTWDVTADVAAWNIDRLTAIPSWLLINDREATGTTNSSVLFASRENATVIYRPLLTIEFIPEPSTLLLLSLALLALRKLRP